MKESRNPSFAFCLVPFAYLYPLYPSTIRLWRSYGAGVLSLRAFNIFSRFRIYPDGVASVDEHGNSDCRSGFQCYNFVAALCGIAASVRRCLGNFQFHFYRYAYFIWYFVEQAHIDFSANGEKFPGIPHHILCKRESVGGIINVMEKPFPLAIVNKLRFL